LVAEAYAEEIVPYFEHYARAALGLARVRPGERVVDVACGPGTLSFLAAAVGAEVDAVDFSSDMLRKLEERQRQFNLSGVRTQQADGMALPFADHSFDAGFSMFGLMFFADRARGFAELRRVLRPGGRVVISSWVPLDQVPLFACLFEAVMRALEIPPSPSNLALADEASCRSELTAAGFGDVTCQPLTHANTFASTEAAWASMERSSAPLVLMRKRFGEAKWSSARQAALEALAGRFGAGPQQVEMTALLSSGITSRS
jgi:ubiquinone/menaquinone biosynthesis C-methylase UbiE